MENPQRCFIFIQFTRNIFLLSLGICLTAFGCRQEQLPPVSDKSEATPIDTAPSGKVTALPDTVGPKSCKFCHPSEYIAWQASVHSNPRVKIEKYAGQVQRFAESLKLSEEDILTKDDRCARCHGTVQESDGGDFRIIAGVSCESCHGKAGGDTPWLNIHVVTHDSDDPLDKPETPDHLRKRVRLCLQRGMIRTSSVYDIAKNCQTCHYISDQELVNAGHPAWHVIGSDRPFELVLWSGGEIRHNFHVDQNHNAAVSSIWKDRTNGSTLARRRIAFLVGQLVELEICLQNLADVATGNENSVFASENQKRLEENLLVSLLETQTVLATAAPVQLISSVNAGKSVLAADDPIAEAKRQVSVVQKAAQSLSGAKQAAWLDKMAQHPTVYDFELAFAMMTSNLSDGERGALFLRTRLENLQRGIQNAALIAEDNEELEEVRGRLLEMRLELWLASMDGVGDLVGDEVAEIVEGAIEAAEATLDGEDPQATLELTTNVLEAVHEITDLNQFAGLRPRIDTWVKEEIGIVGQPFRRR